MREMKDSGVLWIGDIPKGWHRASISFFTSSRSGGTPDRNQPAYWENGSIPWVSSGEVNKGQIWATNEMITDLGSQNSSAKILPPNSVFIALNGQGKTKGMTAILRIAASCNQSLCAFQCKPDKLYYEYLYYCFKAMYKYLRSQAGDDVRDGLAASFVRKQRIPIPPVQEQRRIAVFLNSKCIEIDSMLERTRTSIEEYKKLKQSVITEAVTKGIRGDRQMKDSGVEWIGPVPLEWDVCRLKYRITLINGRAYSDSELLPEGKYKILRVGNLFTNEKWYYSDMELAPDKYCEKGDLLYAWSASFGPYIWSGEKVIYHYHIWKAKLNGLERDYAYYTLMAFTAYKKLDAHGTAMVHLTMANMNKSSIPVPTITEQQEIAAYLDEKCAAIDSLIASKEALITELEAYKKSIIYEYVTGKKEVI